MKIDRIELYLVAMPLISPWRTAYGEDACIESVLVRMISGSTYGWGEASPLQAPTYGPEWARAVFMTMRDWLAPRLVGQDIQSGAQLQALLATFKGNYFAKGGLDLAWWDLYARQRGEPLWRLIGGQSPTVDVGADIGVQDSIEALLPQVARVVEQGYKRLKLKYRPGWDLEMVAAVRRAFPDLTMHIDCNSGYTLDDLPMFRQLDAYNLAMIEQPLAYDDLLDHAELQRQIRTPVCLDETLVSLHRARQAIRVKACRWANIKVARVGGLTNAIAMHNLFQEAGIPCWVGGMLESSVGQGFSLALATLPNIRYPSDIFPLGVLYHEDLAEPALVLSGRAQMTAGDRPGIGTEPHPERLQRMTLERATVE